MSNNKIKQNNNTIINSYIDKLKTDKNYKSKGTLILYLENYKIDYDNNKVVLDSLKKALKKYIIPNNSEESIKINLIIIVNKLIKFLIKDMFRWDNKDNLQIQKCDENKIISNAPKFLNKKFTNKDVENWKILISNFLLFFIEINGLDIDNDYYYDYMIYIYYNKIIEICNIFISQSEKYELKCDFFIKIYNDAILLPTNSNELSYKIPEMPDSFDIDEINILNENYVSNNINDNDSKNFEIVHKFNNSNSNNNDNNDKTKYNKIELIVEPIKMETKYKINYKHTLTSQYVKDFKENMVNNSYDYYYKLGIKYMYSVLYDHFTDFFKIKYKGKIIEKSIDSSYNNLELLVKQLNEKNPVFDIKHKIALNSGGILREFYSKCGKELINKYCINVNPCTAISETNEKINILNSHKKKLGNNNNNNIVKIQSEIDELEKKKLKLLGNPNNRAQSINLDRLIDEDESIKDNMYLNTMAKILAHGSTIASSQNINQRLGFGVNFCIFDLFYLFSNGIKYKSFSLIDLLNNLLEKGDKLNIDDNQEILDDKENITIDGELISLNKVIKIFIGILTVIIELDKPSEIESIFHKINKDYSQNNISLLYYLLNIYLLPKYIHFENKKDLVDLLNNLNKKLKKLNKFGELFKLFFRDNIDNLKFNFNKYSVLGLSTLLNGNLNYDGKDLIKILNFKDVNNLTNKIIIEYIKSLNDTDAMKFVYYITSSKTIPSILNIQGTQLFNVDRENVGEYEVPIAHTCVYRLDVFNLMGNEEKCRNLFKDKMKIAFENLEGFTFAGGYKKNKKTLNIKKNNKYLTKKK